MITVGLAGVSDVEGPIACGAGGGGGVPAVIVPIVRPARRPEVRPAGLEPATKDLEGPRSVQLSYGRSEVTTGEALRGSVCQPGAHQAPLPPPRHAAAGVAGSSVTQVRARRRASIRSAQMRCDSAASGAKVSEAW